MHMRDYTSLKKASLLLAIGLIALAFYVYFSIGAFELVEAIRRIDLRVYSLGAILVVADVAVYSLAWQRFLKALSTNVKLKSAFLFSWASAFVDFIVPSESISGDVVRARLMYNELKGGSGKVTASVLTQRAVLTILPLAAFIVGFLSCIALYREALLSTLGLLSIVAVATASSLTLLALLMGKRAWIERLTSSGLRLLEAISRKRLKAEGLSSKVANFLDSFYEAIETFKRHPKKLALPVTLSISAWFINLLIPFAVFASLGYPVPFSVIIILHSIGAAIQSAPLGVPAETGIFEITMIWLYSSFGMPLDVSAAGVILTRVLTVWMKLALGFLALQWISLKALLKEPKGF